MFFDAGREHVFLKIRFGERYQLPQRAGLDGDFPRRDGMPGIVGANVQRTLAFLPR